MQQAPEITAETKTAFEVDPPEAEVPSVMDEGPITPDAEPENVFRLVRNVFETKSVDEVGPWLKGLVQSQHFWGDIGLLAGAMLFAWLIAHLLKRTYARGKMPTLMKLFSRFRTDRKVYIFRLVLVPTLWVVLGIANGLGWECPIMRTFGLIATLFVFFHLPSKLFRWRLWMRIVATTMFVFAGLHIVGLLDDVTTFLEAQSIKLGTVDISVLDIIKGFISMVLFFWLAGVFSRMTGKRLSNVTEIAPRMQVLLTKMVSVMLYIFAGLLTMGVMGIDIAVLTVFGGALGLGLGFGLQKVVSNLVSGVILLLDKSIEPGDVIEIEGTYGWINALNLRYASVITRDNKEHLIPNEDLITQPVINWSFSSELVRVRAPIGISYDSDVRLAMRLAREAAAKMTRVVEQPAPVCNLLGFGDSSVDLELRFWIADPTNGVGNIRSLVLLEVWDSFKEAGIQFPFPQRDIHIKTETLGALMGNKEVTG